MSQKGNEKRMVNGWIDEFDSYVQEQLKDPEYAEAYRKAFENQNKLLERKCSDGKCTEFYDPETGKTEGGYGPVGCPCQKEKL